MQLHDDARLPICANLYTQIEQLEQDCRSMTLPALHEAIDEIRTKAVAHHLVALEGIAHAFERSIARNRQATAFGLYFDQLKLATGCAAADTDTARDAMLAAISVRLTG
ncbi:hypothetical protein HFP57_09895 [Parasphingopyxis algicola]|uniref:hypothetical protein n=1 Tax=Parasphingopyxis algicola TaxID=2026624 RepID=UPI0015A351B4|nr:hypothetical protein [Parasphingopyxis algicola]QLC25301.1 hypothetical protein HFP57_09895 [Parasphingopyxis algicola]